MARRGPPADVRRAGRRRLQVHDAPVWWVNTARCGPPLDRVGCLRSVGAAAWRASPGGACSVDGRGGVARRHTASGAKGHNVCGRRPARVGEHEPVQDTRLHHAWAGMHGGGPRQQEPPTPNQALRRWQAHCPRPQLTPQPRTAGRGWAGCGHASCAPAPALTQQRRLAEVGDLVGGKGQEQAENVAPRHGLIVRPAGGRGQGRLRPGWTAGPDEQGAGGRSRVQRRVTPVAWSCVVVRGEQRARRPHEPVGPGHPRVGVCLSRPAGCWPRARPAD